MNGYFALLKRELRAITKEKTIIFAVIVQFFIASFSSIILVGIMAFYDPSSIGDNTHVTIRVGVVGNMQSPMLDYLKDGNIRVRPYSNMAGAESAFKRGRIDTIMLIPESQNGVMDMQLIMPQLDTKKTVIFMVEPKHPLLETINFIDFTKKSMVSVTN